MHAAPTPPPQAARLPKIGNAWGPAYEAIAAAKPDLVLAWGTFAYPPVIKRLRRQLGLKVRIVKVSRPADVSRALRQIGGWLGTPRAAARAAARFDKKLKALRDRYQGASPVRVFFQIGTNPAYTVNKNSPITRAIELCGGVNVFASLPRIAEPVSTEAVLGTSPQAVLYTTDHTSRAQIERYWKPLSVVPAAANGHIFGIQTKRITASPQMLAGIRHVCRVLDNVRADGKQPSSEGNSG